MTHRLHWCPTPKKLIAEFEKKFSGYPKKRDGKNTDYAKGKRYGGAITATYRRLGMNLGSIKRIWVCWAIKDPATLNEELADYFGRTGNMVKVIELRIPSSQNSRKRSPPQIMTMRFSEFSA